MTPRKFSDTHFSNRAFFGKKIFVLLRGYNPIICCDIKLKFCTKFVPSCSRCESNLDMVSEKAEFL